jgi:ElaB/YqjD/DUF883 family membrane-anchored ribosome-binding protein
MSEPAYPNLSATEATAARIYETADATAATIRETTEAVRITVLEKAETVRRAVQELRDRLQDRWQQVSDRVTETTAQLPAFRQELREDAAYVADRARYYHRTRPVRALGIIAAAAFVLGVAIGLGRS